MSLPVYERSFESYMGNSKLGEKKKKGTKRKEFNILKRFNMVSSHYYSHEVQLPLVTCCSDLSTSRASTSLS